MPVHPPYFDPYCYWMLEDCPAGTDVGARRTDPFRTKAEVVCFVPKNRQHYKEGTIPPLILSAHRCAQRLSALGHDPIIFLDALPAMPWLGATASNIGGER